jgi:putative sterol carrier protein
MKERRAMTTVRYPTPEWLEASAAASQADPSVQQELASLTTKICFRIKAEPTWGLEEDLIFAGYLTKGVLDKLAFVDEEEAKREANYIMAATPAEWKKLLRKEAKFVTEFMLGRVSLEQGSKVGVFQIAPHSDTFIDVLTRAELQFPDEMSPEELDEFRAYVAQFRQELGV